MGGQRDLRYFWQVVRRYRTGLLLINIGVLLVSFLIASNTTPTYRSTALLLVEPTRFNIPAYADRLVNSVKYDEYYETQFQMLRSVNLAYRVIDALQLWDHPELQRMVEGPPSRQAPAAEGSLRSQHLRTAAIAGGGTGARVAPSHNPALAPLATAAEIRVLDNFLQRLRIVSISKTRLIRVKFDSSDPRLAAQVANAVAEQFVADGQTVRLQAARRAERSLERSLATARQSLTESQRNIERFRQAHAISDRALMSALESSSVLLAGNGLVDAQLRVTELKSLLQTIDSQKHDRAALGSIAALQQDPLVQQLQRDRQTLELQRASLESRFGGRHPRLVAVDAQIASLERTLEVRIDRLIDGFEQELQLAQRRARSAERRVDASKRQAGDLSAALIEFEALQRQAVWQQSLVDRISRQLHDVRTADAQLEPEATLYEPAIASTVPYRPRIAVFMGLAVTSSLIFSIVVAGALARLDNRIASAMQLRRLGLTVLGELPRRRSRLNCSEAAPGRTPSAQTADSPVSYGHYDDAVDSLRTMLLHGSAGSAGKTIMMVSALPAEGKSLACADLAVSLARTGERVLIIDVDVRRASRAPSKGSGSEAGLIAALKHPGSPSVACQRLSRDPRVSVLPYGTLDDTAGPLLRSPRLHTLFDRLREDYDRILVDVSPLLACSDALLFAAVCDSAMCVVKAGCTPLRSVRQALARLSEAGLPLVGAVLTGVRSTPAQPVKGGFRRVSTRLSAILERFALYAQPIRQAVFTRLWRVRRKLLTHHSPWRRLISAGRSNMSECDIL